VIKSLYKDNISYAHMSSIFITEITAIYMSVPCRASYNSQAWDFVRMNV